MAQHYVQQFVIIKSTDQVEDYQDYWKDSLYSITPYFNGTLSLLTVIRWPETG